jgi:ABC-type transporter Mla subunit MlaD
MSILKARRLPLSNKPELEGSIRELVRRESSAIRQAGDNSEQAARELASLVQRISGGSTREVDHLINGLTNLRQKLDDAATRIQSDIIEFASLSQSVMQLTKIVSDGVTQVAKVPDAPGIASESPDVSDTAPVIPEQQSEVTVEPTAY